VRRVRCILAQSRGPAPDRAGLVSRVAAGDDGCVTELPSAPKRLELDVDLVPEQTADDTDAGWGGESRGERDPAAVLRRYLDETPPHHGD